MIFINAVNELRIDRTNAWLEPQNIKKIHDAYKKFKDDDGFAKVMSKEDVLNNNGNLSLQLYVKLKTETTEHDVEELLSEVKGTQKEMISSIENLFKKLKAIGIEG